MAVLNNKGGESMGKFRSASGSPASNSTSIGRKYNFDIENPSQSEEKKTKFRSTSTPKKMEKAEIRERNLSGVPLDYTPSSAANTLETQNSTIANNNSRLNFAGGSPPSRPEPQVPWWMGTLQGIGNVFDAVDRYTGARAVRSAADDFISMLKGKQGSSWGTLGSNMADTFRKGGRNVTGSDILENAGMEKGIGRGVAGFGLDLLLDPTTYLFGGSIVKKGAKGLSEAAAKEATEAAALTASKAASLDAAKGAYSAALNRANAITPKTLQGTFKQASKALPETVAPVVKEAMGMTISKANRFSPVVEEGMKITGNPARQKYLESIATKVKPVAKAADETSGMTINRFNANKNMDKIATEIPFTINAKNVGKAASVGANFKKVYSPAKTAFLKKMKDSTYWGGQADNIKRLFPEAFAETAASDAPDIIKRSLDSEIFAPKGELTASIGSEAPEMQKGIIAGIPFTNIQKMLFTMNKLPSEYIYGGLKKIPVAGNVLGYLEDLLAHNKAPSSLANTGKGETINKLGNMLTGAQEARYGKELELDEYINKAFKDLQKPDSFRVIDFIERGGGDDTLYQRVAQSLAQASQGVPLKDFVETSGGSKLLHDLVKQVAPDFTEQNAEQWWHASDLFHLFAQAEPEHTLLENYVTHLLPKEELEGAMNHLTQAQRAQKVGSSANVYFKARENPFVTIAGLLKAGFHPETDIMKILSTRGKAAIKSSEMNKWWDAVKNTGLVRPGKQEGDNFVKTIFPELQGNIVDKDFAALLQQWLDPQLTHHPALQQMLNVQYNPLFRAWKLGNTAYMPAYHMRNIPDNMAKVLFGARTGADAVAKSAKVGFANMMKNMDETVKLGEKTYSIGDIMQAFRRLGGEGSGSFVGDLPSIATSPTAGERAKKLAMTMAKSPIKAAEASESSGKMAIFLDRIAKGFSPEQAMDEANKYLFNYKEISPAVRAARTIFPFITWKTKNTPLMLQQAIDNPLYLDAIRKLLGNMYAGTGVAQSDMPDYALQAGYVPVGKTESGNVNALPMNLAANDLNVVGQPDLAVKEAVNMLNPVLRVPMETMVFNKPAFMDKEFKNSKEKYQYAMRSFLGAPKGLWDNYQKAQQATNAEEVPPAEQAAKIFNMVKEINPVNTQIGRNYDYIKSQNENMSELKGQGTVIPTINQIEKMELATKRADLLGGGNIEQQLSNVLNTVAPGMSQNSEYGQRVLQRAVEILRDMQQSGTPPYPNVKE